MKLYDYLHKTREELEAMTTPQLLMLRKLCFGGFRDCGSPCHCESSDPIDIEFNSHLAALQIKVHAILPNRKHVPGKAEAKAIRQARAKQGR